MQWRKCSWIIAVIVLIFQGYFFFQIYTQKNIIMIIKERNYTGYIKGDYVIVNDESVKIWNKEKGKTVPTMGSKENLQNVAKGKAPQKTNIGKNPQNVTNNFKVLPPKKDLLNMNYEVISLLYDRYVKQKQAICKKLIRLGNIRDGGWDICDDEEYRPRKQNCTVYSFGINFDFSFDDAVSRVYGCQVHSFDPSMKKADHKRSNKIYFHALGLSNKEQTHRGWKMKRFKDIREKLGDSQKPIDVLKIDIEEWELKVIPEMVGTGSMTGVAQFVVEIHVDLGRGRREPNINKYRDALGALKDLYDEGFRIIHTHENPTCYFRHKGRERRNSCHEVSFIRVHDKKL